MGDVRDFEGQGEQVPRFEALLGRLEEVVLALEGGGLSLDESLKLFEEGVLLSRKASEQIDAAERRIEELLSDGREVPFRDQAPEPEEGEL